MALDNVTDSLTGLADNLPFWNPSGELGYNDNNNNNDDYNNNRNGMGVFQRDAALCQGRKLDILPFDCALSDGPLAKHCGLF